MPKSKLPITGALLVGGESRRMGENKAFLKIGEKMLCERSLEVLNNVCQEVVISSRQAESYEMFGYPIILDRIKAKGPLGGLYSILSEAKHNYVFVVACDMPLLSEEGIRSLYGQVENFDALVPRALGRLHPLHAFYHKRILSLVEDSVLKEKLRITEILNECRSKIIQIDKNSELNPNIHLKEENLMNVNTPGDWESLMLKLNNNKDEM